MDLDEAVLLVAETTVIVPGSRLDEARRTVLDVVERAQIVAKQSPHAQDRYALGWRDAGLYALGETT